MRVVAFLQLHNELENGNLIRCLDNCSRWADDIFIYDDCSDDGSKQVYLKYTDEKNIIFGSERKFQEELFHKQELLALTLKTNPNWIGWIDGDAILDRFLTANCKDFLQMIEEKGYDAAKLHNLNLWRHPAYYRLDNKFNGLWHVVFWKNNGNLHYEPTVGLHQRQYPHGIEESRMCETPQKVNLLHYGFSSERLIVKKYLTYKALGQDGWELDRLIDEQSSFVLEKVPKKFYPEDNIPEDYDTAVVPQPITYDEYRKYHSWDEYKYFQGLKERVKIQPVNGQSRARGEVHSIGTYAHKINPQAESKVSSSFNIAKKKERVTIIGMIYRSTQYLDFMMDGIRKYCLNSKDYDVDYLIIANDPAEKVLNKLRSDNINHIVYNDPNPDDYYLNRVYRAWNFGGFNAPGDIIVFINSDETLSPYWLENLLKHLNPDTIPCSRLVESNKMPSGQHGLKAEFGRHPSQFDEQGWLRFVDENREDKIADGGLYMPCAFYKKDFIEAEGYPEGNLYEGGVGAHQTKFLYSGDDYLFHYHPVMSKKRQITSFDSLVYHIIEGEKDE